MPTPDLHIEDAYGNRTSSPAKKNDEDVLKKALDSDPRGTEQILMDFKDASSNLSATTSRLAEKYAKKASPQTQSPAREKSWNSFNGGKSGNT